MIYEGLMTVVTDERRNNRRRLPLLGESQSFTYESYESLMANSYVGITEFGDLSDPPRKYRELHVNRAEIQRNGSSPAFQYVTPSRSVVFNTSGTKTHRLNAVDERPGAGGSTDIDTMESFVWNGNFATGSLTWVKEKRRKYTVGDGTLGTGETSRNFALHAGREGDQTGPSSSNLFLRVTWPVWKGTYWQINVSFVVSGTGSYRLSVIEGDRDPGDPEVTGVVFAGEGSTVFYLPPNRSFRLWVTSTTWGTEWDGSTYPAHFVKLFPAPWTTTDGLADCELNQWFYLPSGDGYAVDDPVELNDGPKRYEERLAIEDTPLDAMLRGTEGVQYSLGTSSIAFTTSVSGGTSAESHTNIAWQGRVVKTGKTFTGLTIGNIYEVTVTLSKSLISGGPTTTDQVTFEYTATAETEEIFYNVIAPVGYNQQVTLMEVTDLGAPEAPPTQLDADVETWHGRILLAGGTITEAELLATNTMVVAMKAASIWSQHVYILPLVGDFAAILVPLRDSAGAGNATNNNFVSGDYSLATGLQGNGTNKTLTIPRTTAELGSSGSGGLGVWVLSLSSTGTPIGARGNTAGRPWIIAVSSTYAALYWGSGPTETPPGGVSSNAAGWYSGRRASITDRELFKNGVSVGTDTDSQSGTAGNNDQDHRLCGTSGNGADAYGGRIGFGTWNNGTLSDANEATLYSIINAFMTAIGRS